MHEDEIVELLRGLESGAAEADALPGPDCPPLPDLLDWLDGDLPRELHDAVTGHLRTGCPSCLSDIQRLREAAKGAFATIRESVRLAPAAGDESGPTVPVKYECGRYTLWLNARPVGEGKSVGVQVTVDLKPAAAEPIRIHILPHDETGRAITPEQTTSAERGESAARELLFDDLDIRAVDEFSMALEHVSRPGELTYATPLRAAPATQDRER